MEDEGTSARLAWLHHPNPLVRWGGRAWLLLGLLLVGWALWHAASLVRLVLEPLIVALFPAAVLLPLVDWLDARGWRRGVGATLVTAVFVVLVLGLLTLLGWQVSQQLSGLVDEVTVAYEDLRSTLGSPGWLPTDLAPSTLLDASEQAQDSSSGGGNGGGGGGGGLGSVVLFGRSVMEFGAQFFLGIVALFFYLRDREVIGRFLIGLFPARHQGHARVVGAQSWQTVADYVRGQTVVALADGVLFAIGLLFLGVPLAWVLGAIVAIGAYVPVVGSIVAGAIGVGVALVSGGLTTGLLALALIVGVQQLEGNVLAPYVLGRQLHVHPLVVLVAVTAGAVLLGPLGALIGVPVAASLYQASSYLREEVA